MDFEVMHFGATGDGHRDDTHAILKAIEACSANGGGRVIFESGTYLADQVTLKSNVRLFLQFGAVLKASNHLENFTRPAHLGHPAFITAIGCENSGIEGAGEIHGNREYVTKQVSLTYICGNGHPRPVLVYIENGNNIHLRDFTIRDSAFWTLHLFGCQNIEIEDLKLLNDLHCANNDGIDLDHCKNANVRNCRIECADDCIALKNTKSGAGYGNSENITVLGCLLKSASTAFKIGTESFGDFINIRVADCKIEESNRGISLQLRDSGSIRDVVFEAITITTRRYPTEWMGSGEPIAITLHPHNLFTKNGRIDHVVFRNITCDGENGILVCCAKRGRLSDIVFEDVRVTIAPKTQWYQENHDLRPGVGKHFLVEAMSEYTLHNAQEGISILPSKTTDKDITA